ncbi:PAS domain S-box-containing protein [Algoriphagus aquaeductus]|uniref:histidine kinase n=1 Tax=Algoriphagus aquaeductus TaxID=475299 RepID=A0A326RNQ7_9BACT|nr:PAS domain S-box-containing protein [Algoriphagus aquaeductus]
MDIKETKPYQKILILSTFIFLGLSLLLFATRLFEFPYLNQIFQDVPGLKFNSVVLLVLAAIICHFWIREAQQGLRFGLVSLIFGVSFLSLIQDVTGFSFGIDELLFQDVLGRQNQVPFPGRMPGMTSLIFVFFSVGYFILQSKSSRKEWGQILIHGITLLCFIALLGYMLRVPDFYRLSFLTGISPITAFSWFLYSQIISLQNPNLGITGLLTGSQIGSKMARRFTPRLVLVLVILAGLRIELHRYDLIQVEFGIVLFALSFLLLGLWVVWDAASWLNYSDIKRRKAEEDLKLNNQNLEKLVLIRNQELHAILDTAEACIVSTDKNGLIRHFSKGAERMLGYTPEELIEKAKPLIFHDNIEVETRMKKMSEELGKTITGKELFTSLPILGKVYSDEWTYLTKSGKRIPVQLNISPITSPEGKNLGFIGIATDISQLADSRLKLRELLKKLEGRNHQLLNFAHVVSHNLRTPVYSIETLLGYYQEESNPEQRNEYWSLILGVVQSLSQSMEEALEVLRVQEDQGQNLEEVFFEEIFEKTKLALTGKILESDAELIEDFSNLQSIQFSKSYMESVFLNLLSNAIKYRDPERRPHINLKSGFEDGNAFLEISDNGLGIDLERNGDKIFGMNKVFHDHPEAKGVGLYIVKTQIESMGGKITVQSKPHVGTTFRIQFS